MEFQIEWNCHAHNCKVEDSNRMTMSSLSISVLSVELGLTDKLFAFYYYAKENQNSDSPITNDIFFFEIKFEMTFIKYSYLILSYPNF